MTTRVDRGVALESVERGGDLAHHGQGQRVERLGPIEGDEAGAAAPLDERLRRLVSGVASRRGDLR